MHKNTVLILITGLVCITVITGAAILSGHDGHLITSCVSALAAITTGVVGYEVGKGKTDKHPPT